MKTLLSTFNTKRKMFVFMKLKPGEECCLVSLCFTESHVLLGEMQANIRDRQSKKGDWEQRYMHGPLNGTTVT